MVEAAVAAPGMGTSRCAGACVARASGAACACCTAAAMAAWGVPPCISVCMPAHINTKHRRSAKGIDDGKFTDGQHLMARGRQRRRCEQHLHECGSLCHDALHHRLALRRAHGCQLLLHLHLRLHERSLLLCRRRKRKLPQTICVSSCSCLACGATCHRRLLPKSKRSSSRFQPSCLALRLARLLAPCASLVCSWKR